MPYLNSSSENPRISEIKNLRPEIFKIYLEGLDEKTIEIFEDAKTGYGYCSEIDRTCRNNYISNKITIEPTSDTFTLKLIELAALFPSDEQWKKFSVGDTSKGEGPLSNEQLACAYNTTVENVVMKKMLEAAISDFKKDLGESYSKKRNN